MLYSQHSIFHHQNLFIAPLIFFLVSTIHTTLRRYIYFAVVVRLEWSNNHERYASSSIGTGQASHTRQVKGDDPDKKGYPGWA